MRFIIKLETKDYYQQYGVNKGLKIKNKNI